MLTVSLVGIIGGRTLVFICLNYDINQLEFKAGLHYRYVMAGKIGVVKRDIAFLAMHSILLLASNPIAMS